MKKLFALLLVMLLSVRVITGFGSTEDTDTVNENINNEVDKSTQAKDDQADDTSSTSGGDKVIYAIEGLELSYWESLNVTVADSKTFGELFFGYCEDIQDIDYITSL